MVSGGFDPIHSGHINMLREAADLGEVVVAINSDDWLVRKKGYRLLPWQERAAIVMAIRYVSDVVGVDDADGTVVEAIRRVKPDIFANGGDRLADNTPEVAYCEHVGIRSLFNIGGSKTASSSEFVEAVR